MKYHSDGRRPPRLVRLCALVALLVPLLAACGGPAAPPVAGNATTVANTASTSAATTAGSTTAATTGAGTAAAATTTTGGTAGAATTAVAGSTTVSAATASAAQTLPAMTTTVANTAQAGAAVSSEPAPPDQQVLRVGFVEPESIDPATFTSATAAATVAQLFTGLTGFGPDLKPVPAIAESWQFNQDNTQVTFKLRDSQWSDGKLLTAGDFVYAWRRLADPRTASPTASFITGVVKGATALNSTPVSDTAKLQQAAANFGATALDPRTLQVTLEKPAPFFLSIAAVADLVPGRKDIVEQYGAAWTDPAHLVGNGPFVLKSWTKGSEMTLASNPHYYAGQPRLATLSFRFVSEAVAFANYQAGAIDTGPVPPAEVAGVRANPQLKDQIVASNQLGAFMLSWNTTAPPFDNVKVRQAFAAAIDRQTIVRQVVNGVGTPAYSFIPPGMPGHLTEAEAGDAAQRYDPAKAKALLAEAGYPNGRGFPALKLTYRNDTPYSLVTQRAQADLQNNLGVKIELDPREPRTYFAQVYKSPPQFFFAGWRADFPDPYDWDTIVLGPGNDPGKWQNAQFARLIDQADREADPNKRIADYKQAERIAAQDAARVFVYWFGTFWLRQPYVKGLTTTPMDLIPGQYFFKDAWIAKH